MKTIFAGPWQMRDGGWSAPDVGPITATLDLSDNLQRNSGTAGDGATERGCGLWQAECEPAGIPDDYTVLGVTDWSEITFGATERDAWDSLFRVSLPSSTTLQQACVYSLLDGSDPTGEGTPPLWPYRGPSGGYHLTIQFGGSRYSERFTRLHTHALTRWIPHIHAELRRMWAISQQHCAEWLGWICHEITVDTGIAPDPATTSLIPADLRSEGLLPAEFHSSYSDNFNDGDLTGWTQGRGTFTNPGTVCRCADASISWPCLTYTSTLSGSNHYSQAKINHTGSSGLGVWNRRSTVDGLNEGYISYFRPADTTWRIARFVGGVATFVYTSGAQALTAWDTVYGASFGSLHTIARNGSAFNSGGTTDTQYPTGSIIGLGGTAGTREYDDWLAADFVSGIPAHAQHYFRQRACS